MELVKASEYGLDEKQGAELTKDLIQILKEREVLSQKYAEVIKMEITVTNIPVFKELRLKIRDNRTKGIEVWHKANKAFFLQGGKFVDAIKNKASAENERMEENLLSNENYFENLEKARIEKLQSERAKLLTSYKMDVIPTNLGNMKEEDWGFFLTGVKSSYEQKKAAEKKAEEDRIEKEKKEAAEKARLKADNERLLKEKQERDQKEKIAQQAEKDRIQAELKKGDEDKIKDLVNDLRDLKLKYMFKSEKNQKVYYNVRDLLQKVIIYIEENTK